MERLTERIDSHLLDNGKLCKEYSLNSKIELNDYSCMDIPNAVYNKLGELEDVLEEFELTSEEDLRNYLNFKGNMAIWEGELNYKNKISELQQQLHSQPAEIVEKIKKRLCDRLNIIAGYGQMTVDEFSFFVESEFTKDIDEILKEYGGNNE